MDSKPKFLQKYPLLKDLLSLALFVICVVVGTVILNAFVFRSYNVVGSSMENTLQNDDRVIVNRLPVSWSHFLGQEYVPKRGQIIVFANGAASGPLTCEALVGQVDQYIIKRVIAFPGERVTVKNGVDATNGPKEYSSGDVDMIVPEGEIFVAGDNREGSHSFDSRSGLGTIPYCRIIGPAAVRIYPFDKVQLF